MDVDNNEVTMEDADVYDEEIGSDYGDDLELTDEQYKEWKDNLFSFDYKQDGMCSC